jgi:hypothetical protein
MSSEPQIHAVVEVAVDDEKTWVNLPPKPWPSFIRLSGQSTANEVAFLVGTLSSYGTSNQTPAKSPEELVRTFPKILPGGFASVDDTQTIYPSCCSGLENWSDWLDVLSSGESPWMGHDPAPFIELVDGRVHIWADGGLGDKPASVASVVFTIAQFESALRRAVADLEEFTIPLCAWLQNHAPQQASLIGKKFKHAFVTRRV